MAERVDPLADTPPGLEVQDGHDRMRQVPFDVLRQLDDLQFRRATGTADLEVRRAPRIGLTRRDDVSLAVDPFAAVDVLQDDGSA